jgi:hypothetical protein
MLKSLENSNDATHSNLLRLGQPRSGQGAT